MPPSLLHRPGREEGRSCVDGRSVGVSPCGAPRGLAAGLGRSVRDPCDARAFERWTIGEQRRRLDIATCRGDELPEPAAIDLAQYVSFLAVQ